MLKNITFDRLLEILPSADFCRINKREILSIKAVQVFSFDEITTSLTGPSDNNIKLTLGENYRSEFLRKIKD